jgi:hypothetical protein
MCSGSYFTKLAQELVVSAHLWELESLYGGLNDGNTNDLPPSPPPILSGGKF